MLLETEFRTIIEEQAPDWSDLYFELRLHREELFDSARLWMAPTQIERIAGKRDLFSFRVSHTQGYGCHAELAARCLRKLDVATMKGELTLMRSLHGVRRNLTQGPLIGPTY